MNTVERIQKVLEYTNKGTVALAQEVGLSRTRIDGMIRMKVKTMPFEVADKICLKYSTISREWLLTGEGEMLVENEQQAEEPQTKNVNDNHTINELLAIIHVQNQQAQERAKLVETMVQEFIKLNQNLFALTGELVEQRSILIKMKNSQIVNSSISGNVVHEPDAPDAPEPTEK